MSDAPIPYTKDRLMIVDWASLSYHQLHALLSKKNTAQVLEIETADQELAIWRSGMLSKMLRYIKMFNPKDIVLTLEGVNLWRNELVKDYYNNNTMVHYDKTGYYVVFDNFIYKVIKNADGSIKSEKLDPIEFRNSLPDNGKPLIEMPERVQDTLWEYVLPKYKGQRNKQPWDFIVDKKYWRQYKEDYAKEISTIFRAHVIGIDEAEGDDVVYVAMNYWAKNYDSIILVTRDSDFNQLLTEKKLKIFNHQKEEFVVCSSPDDYIEVKTLCGDKSDNINGMARPNKKTQLGEAGAIKLYESVGNIYALAKEEGWDNQYQRNQRLIKLSYIPTHVQRQICELLDASKPELSSFEDVNWMGYNNHLTNEFARLKNLGFYALNDLDYVNNNPNIFNASLFEVVDHAEDEIYEPSVKYEEIKAFDSPFGDIF